MEFKGVKDSCDKLRENHNIWNCELLKDATYLGVMKADVKNWQTSYKEYVYTHGSDTFNKFDNRNCLDEFTLHCATVKMNQQEQEKDNFLKSFIEGQGCKKMYGSEDPECYNFQRGLSDQDENKLQNEFPEMVNLSTEQKEDICDHCTNRFKLILDEKNKKERAEIERKKKEAEDKIAEQLQNFSEENCKTPEEWVRHVYTSGFIDSLKNLLPDKEKEIKIKIDLFIDRCNERRNELALENKDIRNDLEGKWNDDPNKNLLQLCTPGGKEGNELYWAGPVDRWIKSLEDCKRRKNNPNGICIVQSNGICIKQLYTSGVGMAGQISCNELRNVNLVKEYAKQIDRPIDSVAAACREIRSGGGGWRRRRLLNYVKPLSELQIEYTVTASNDDAKKTKDKIWKMKHVDNVKQTFVEHLRNDIIKQKPSIKKKINQVKIKPIEAVELKFYVLPHIKRTPSSELRHTVFTMKNVLQQMFMNNKKLILENKNFKLNLQIYATSLEQLFETLNGKHLSIPPDAWEEKHGVCPIAIQWGEISKKLLNDFDVIKSCQLNIKKCKTLTLQPFASISAEDPSKKQIDNSITTMIKDAEREAVKMKQRGSNVKNPVNKPTNSNTMMMATVMKQKAKTNPAMGHMLKSKNVAIISNDEEDAIVSNDDNIIVDNSDYESAAIDKCGDLRFINLNGKNAFQFKLNEMNLKHIENIIPSDDLKTFFEFQYDEDTGSYFVLMDCKRFTSKAKPFCNELSDLKSCQNINYDSNILLKLTNGDTEILNVRINGRGFQIKSKRHRKILHEKYC
jgi:hypothetical protein